MVIRFANGGITDVPEIILNMTSIKGSCNTHITLAFTNHGRILEFDHWNDVWIESHYSGRELPPKDEG